MEAHANTAAPAATGAENVAWDLSELYMAVDDPAINRDLDEADRLADDLANHYRGRIASLGAEEMLAFMRQYEAIQELSSKLGSYAQLHWTTNTEDASRGALMQRVTERDSRLSQKVVFFELEWAAAPDEAAAGLLADPTLAHYRHFLEVVRLYRPHLLTEPEEKILSEKAVTGVTAWVRFFDEVHGAARFRLDGQAVPLQTMLSQLYNPDRDSRRQAAASITEGLRDMRRSTTFIFNNILADKASTDRLRNYPTWISSRNLGNQVDDATVDALIAAVTSRYDVVARYYTLKRRLLSLDQLFDYDRYAPLPAADRRFAWDQARSIVVEAYGRFHPRMAEIVSRFFEGRWIDAPVRPGKRGGAYCASTIPSLHPYVFMNYEARPRDVTTLAHELGHGVHGYLARQQGILQQHAPLTMAETASVFGEMLVFQDLLRAETNPAIRLAMLTTKLEDSFATVFRQVAMNRFEDAIHTARRGEGELTTERYGDLWMETQSAMFRDSVTLTPDYGLWWSYIPHFLHTPGYVYAYAFGELLVLALYARYQKVGSDFAGAYLDMLAAGGSDWPQNIVRPLGVDLTNPNFWHQGLQMLDDMVAEAERLAAVA